MERTLRAEAVAPDRNGWVSHGHHFLGDCTAEMFMKGGCKVLVSREDHSGKLRWHLSISRVNRYPHWDEIKDARYSLLPHELTFAQILPPPRDYTNLHKNCFHLWEIDEAEW